MKLKYHLLFLLLLSSILVVAQHKVRVYGYVVDPENRSLEQVNVRFNELNIATTTNSNGYYELNVELRDSAALTYTLAGFQSIRYMVNSKQRVVQISVQLPYITRELSGVSVRGQRRQTSTMDVLDVSKLKLIPNTNGGIESMLITFPGVNSSNELSSQYNVRGGNFDENIVYVNGIEVYRPLLVRAGQQEGLSFINPDMVGNLAFSSGGFDARYGDKMSSVLDINYKKPETFEGAASMSLLGASAYIGTAGKRFTQMHGIRYKTSAYLLGSLDTQGEYSPSFVDYQTYLTYQLTPKTDITFLGNFSQNSYRFIPQTRETTFGTYSTIRKLTVYFEGQEKDLFRTSFGALTLNYKPKDHMKLSVLTSAFNTNEHETYDILGEYILNDVAPDQNGEATAGDALGIGKYQQHARNRLTATVMNVAHLGEYDVNRHKLRWGINFQTEKITDRIGEWERRDSAGYTIPQNPNQLELYYNLKASTDLTSYRSTAFFQDTYKWRNDAGAFSVTAGLRANYWTFNNELLVSPRVSVSFLPRWEKEFSFRLAAGLYYQAPFYKELRDTISDAQGNVSVYLNKNIKAQRSFHLVLGGDRYFRAWGRPFKFTTEAYLKLSDRVISYDVDNVRVRYSGQNDAKAYTAGVDFKLYGELVPGTDSWINFSLMQSKENLLNDSYVNNTYDENGKLKSSETVYPGWISRPGEQRFSFSMLLQDYLPNNPKYKLQLKFIVSDGLPFSPVGNSRFRSAFRAPAYRRVDLGASRVLVNGDDKLMSRPFFKHVKNIWINLEVFNLLDIKNVNSYYWISDASGTQMAVPNYLTGRQLNLKLMVDLK